jgi:hypothetical protein
MRKSTTAALLLLGMLLFVFLWFGIRSVEEHRPEITLAGDLTREFEAELDSHPELRRVRAKRERGSAQAIVASPDEHVLLLNATPSEATWARDPTGMGIARRLADAGHRQYGPDRATRYVEVVLLRPNGEKVRLGFRENRDGALEAFAVAPLPPS